MYAINGETISLFTGGAVPYGTSLPVTFYNTYTWGCGSSVGKTFSSTGLNGDDELRAALRLSEWHQRRVADESVPVYRPDARDNSYNDTAITKIQYTKNFGSTAFLPHLRLHVLQRLVPQRTVQHQLLLLLLPARAGLRAEHAHARPQRSSSKISSTSRICSASRARTRRLGSCATTTAFYNLGGEGNYAIVVNAADPYGGYCYAPSVGGTSVVNCNVNKTPSGPGYSVPSLAGASCAVPGKPRTARACTYMVAENGLNGTYSGTVPNFYGASSPTSTARPTSGCSTSAFGSTASASSDRTRLAPPLGGCAAARLSGSTRTTSTTASTTRPGRRSRIRARAQPCPAGSHGSQRAERSAQQLHLQHLAASHQRERTRRIRTTCSASPTAAIRKRRTRRSSSTTRARRTWRTTSDRTSCSSAATVPGYPIHAADLDQLRHLVGTPRQEHRLVVQADAVLAADARSDPAVLPDTRKTGSSPA